MDLQKDIKKLVTYGLDKKLIMPEDEIYTINQYLEVFRLDEYEDPDIEGEEIILPEILDRLTDVAYDRYIIKSDDIVTRDLFDTKLMGILTPKPSQVIKEFRTYYEESPKKATEFSMDSARIQTISEETASKRYEMESKQSIRRYRYHDQSFQTRERSESDRSSEKCKAKFLSKVSALHGK